MSKLRYNLLRIHHIAPTVLPKRKNNAKYNGKNVNITDANVKCKRFLWVGICWDIFEANGVKIYVANSNAIVVVSTCSM